MPGMEAIFQPEDRTTGTQLICQPNLKPGTQINFHPKFYSKKQEKN